MVEQQPREKTIRQVCEYLSPDLKQAVFNLLWADFQNEEYLAQKIGCSVKVLRGWKGGKGAGPNDKYMPVILSMALTICPEAKKLLAEGLVQTVQRLCAELGIGGEVQGEKAWSKENLSFLMDVLDEMSRKTIWYLLWHRHARLAELTKLTGASADMEVLARLREVINPTAVSIFGRPVLEFSASRIDHITGKKVLFHWWLLDFTEDNQPLTGEGGKLPADLFDEDGQIVIVAEVSPSISVSDMVKVEQRNGILTIRLDKLRKG